MKEKLKKFMEQLEAYNKNTYDKCQKISRIVNNLEQKEKTEVSDWELKYPFDPYKNSYAEYFHQSLCKYLNINSECLKDIREYKKHNNNYDIIVEPERICLRDSDGYWNQRYDMLIESDIDSVLEKIIDLTHEMITKWREEYNQVKECEKAFKKLEQQEKDFVEYNRIKNKYNL